MKKLLVLFALLVAGCIEYQPARADVTDEMHKLPPQAQCQQMAGVFQEGLEARNHGVARKISNYDKSVLQKWMESGNFENGEVEVPKDAMYVNGWDNLSDRDKELYTKLAFAGWDEADKMINEATKILEEKNGEEWKGKINTVIPPGYVHIAVQHWYDECVKAATSEKQVEYDYTPYSKVPFYNNVSQAYYLRKVASSERLPELKAKFLRVVGCIQNLPIWREQCEKAGGENCEQEVLEKYFHCSQLDCAVKVEDYLDDPKEK